MKARLVLQHFGIDSESAELIFNFLSVDWVHQHHNLTLELLEEIRPDHPLSCPRKVPAVFGRIDIDRESNRVSDLYHIEEANRLGSAAPNHSASAVSLPLRDAQLPRLAAVLHLFRESLHCGR